MNKIFHSYDQEELTRVVGQMATLVENSAGVKKASSDSMSRKMLEDCKPDKDHALVHLIAMGDHERYSFNKNGDAWPKAACKKYHGTFVTHGHLFREHRNRDAKTQGIGQIKASCYNEPMGRIELAVWANKKKADDIIEKVASEKGTSYSMSARVPADRSSITGKLAKNPGEYDEFTKYRMGQWIPEHNKFAFVYNDDPTFFDISYVKNPADRIAHHLEYQMDKAASAFMNSVDLAALEGVCIPDELRAGCLSFSRQADLVKLASLEEYLDAVATGTAANDSRSAFCKVAGTQALSEQLSEEQLQAFRALQPGTLFRKLAKRSVLLPFESFASYVLNKPVATIMEDASVKEASAALPALFRKIAGMAAQVELENVCDAGSEFSSMADLAANDPVDKLLDKAGDQLSAEPEKVRMRVLDTSSQCQPMTSGEKLASLALSPEASTLLQTYGLYKLAALEAIESIHEQPTQDGLHLLVVLQNRK